ncbi:MAG TPA: NADH:ubiquinone oxidoreductase [Spirochaetota bacterium]
MIQSIKLRLLQGDPIIHDVKNAAMPSKFRGVPIIEEMTCPKECTACRDACPVHAIDTEAMSIDLGHCTFCPICEKACPENKIRFTQNYHLASDRRENLIISQKTKLISPVKASAKIRSYFGKSLRLRQVSAGGCNGCELELNALNNVNFDMGRFGIDFVASPRHADGIVITGPITSHMAHALEICYDAVPDPKIIILNGACAISGGFFCDSPEVQREFLDTHRIDLFIPGCPPHPLTFINGLLDWLQ